MTAYSHAIPVLGAYWSGFLQTYVPDIERRTQDNWIKSFYSSNQYIEFDAVERQGIKKPSKYLSSLFPKGTTLESCHVAESVIDQVDSAIESAIEEGQWVDIMEHLPAPCTVADAVAISVKCTSLTKGKPETFTDSVVVSQKFISSSKELFEPKMKELADAAASAPKQKELTSKPQDDSGADSQGGEKSRKEKRDEKKDKRAKNKGKQAAADDDDDDAQGGGGGGGKGRKGKKGKKGGKHQQDDDEEFHAAPTKKRGSQKGDQWDFLSVKEIQNFIEKEAGRAEYPDGFTAEFAAFLHRPLNATFQERVRDAFLKGTDSGDKRRTLEALQEEFRVIYGNAVMFHKGVQQFSGQAESEIGKHLARTLGQSLLNIVAKIQATANFIKLDEKAVVDFDTWTKILDQLPKEPKAQLNALQKSMQGQNLDAFFDLIDSVAEEISIFVKRADKKRDRCVTIQW